MRATQTRKPIVLSVVLSLIGMLTWGTATWASTRVGNAELQLWYRDRNTFHTDGGKHFDWVQWRNEVFGWLVYENLVQDGLLLGKQEVPWVKSATLNARYRFRADPVYSIRDHYRNLYDRDERENFIIPENGFRDLFLDMDFGEVGPGRLSMRVGNQQIVWGESDLFRSIDVINPLRIDQNQGAGEKFDEFRSPVWAVKWLYNIGDVGSWFSNVSIEPFWSPRYRNGSSNLILESAFRLPHHIRGCLDQNDHLVRYNAQTCANTLSSSGQHVFIEQRQGYLGERRIRHPWSIFAANPNPRDGTPDFSCGTQRCSPDIAGDRISFFANVANGSFKGPLNGAFNKGQAGGVRVIGTSIWGVDWSLNYAFIPTGPSGSFDINKMFNSPAQGGGLKSTTIFNAGIPGQTLEEGLKRCLSENGKSQETTKGQSGTLPAFLVGVDLFGYNNPKRFGKTGALQADGNPKPGKHNAVRPGGTFCATALFDWKWSHVSGFTATYNDFDYTGMVFRLEESYSTREVIRRFGGGLGVGRRFTAPLDQRTYSDNIDEYTPVWRSMVGFDLLRSYSFFRYIPFLHHSFYDQAWFLSGQWLMEHNFDHVANNFCQNVDNIGNGYTAEQVAADRAQGIRSYSNPQCRRYRWNHLFTLGFANQGLFASRVETRNAVVLEPRDKQWILYSQWWWRNVLGYENVELSAGVAWYPGSAIGESWSAIQHFADRDQLWLEFTYYIL